MSSRQSTTHERHILDGDRALRVADEIVSLLRYDHSTAEILEEIVRILKDFTGFYSVGILLLGQGDHQYAAQCGSDFPPDKESICRKLLTESAGPDSDERPVGQCLGIDMVRGRTDLSQRYFSPGGSFWTNDLSRILASAANHIRCPLTPPFGTYGQRALAVVPLRAGGEMLGLMRLSHPSDAVLSSQLLECLEGIGGIAGNVLARVAAQEALWRSKRDFEVQAEQMASEQQKLLMGRHQLELAVGAGDLGSWDWNITTGEISLDRGWSVILGYSPDEYDPHSRMWKRLIHPDDKRRVIKNLKRHLAGIIPAYETEYRLRAKSGEWKWVLDRGKIVERDAHDRPMRMAGIYFDITARKRVEEALHQSEERLRRMFEAAEDCIYFKDTFLTYAEVNPAMCALLGLPAVGIIGHTDEELFGKAEAQIIADSDRLVLAGQTVEQEHTRVVGGMDTTFLEIKTPLRDSDGEVVGIFGISRDVTHRRHAEALPRIVTHETRSPRMRSVLVAARAAAQTDSIVLLTGESGAGKDYVAHYIHGQSRRSHGPFFAINCAAISAELAESELFGYESGAFTGARGAKKGLLELAEGGTILLNEIGELSPAIQSKLLTFLDTRQFTRVGGVKVCSVNARLIAATNQDLEEEVRLNRFRKDLYYRLEVISIEIPALRERAEDIPSLVSHLLPVLAHNMGIDATPVTTPDALKALESYDWPGNVRELRNVLERALILCDKKAITPKDVAFGGKLRGNDVNREWAMNVGFPKDQSLNDVVQDVKRRLVVEALERAGGKRKRAAALLGLTADALKHYMKLFDLYG